MGDTTKTQNYFKVVQLLRMKKMKADSQVCQPNLYNIARTKTKTKARTKANTRTKSKARTKSSSRVCVGQVGIKEDEKGWHHFHRDTCSDNLHQENLVLMWDIIVKHGGKII